MAIQAIAIDGKTVWIEVVPGEPDVLVPLPSEGGVEMENTSTAGRAAGAASQIEQTVGAVLRPVASALAAAGPDEWTVEMSLGFKGSAGIPFLVDGEANGSVKVTAKWNRDPRPAGLAKPRGIGESP